MSGSAGKEVVVVVEAGAEAMVVEAAVEAMVVEAVVQDLLCVRSAAGLTAVSSLPCCTHCVTAWPSPSQAKLLDRI
jgi:hypothetical protein